MTSTIDISNSLTLPVFSIVIEYTILSVASGSPLLLKSTYCPIFVASTDGSIENE